MMFRRFILFLIMICAWVGMPVAAQGDVLVEFIGGVGDNACTYNFRGEYISSANNTVVLPAVKNGLNAAGETFGDTSMYFVAEGCGLLKDSMWVHMHSISADGNGRGRFNETNQVRFEIHDVDDNGNTQMLDLGVLSIVGMPPLPGQGTVTSFIEPYPPSSSRLAIKEYVIRYYAEQPVSYVGGLTASVMVMFQWY